MKPVIGFFQGASYFPRGFGKLLQSPILMGLSIIPVMLTIIILGGFAWGSAWLVGNWLQQYLRVEVEGRILFQSLIFLAVLYVSYLIYLPLTRIFLAPVSEKISLRTSRINSTGFISENNLGFFRAIAEGVKLVALQLLVVVFVLILSLLLPPVGVPVGIFVTICFCGMDFLDVPLSVQGYSFRQKTRYWVENFSPLLGFSSAGYLLLHIPILNLLVLPVGVIGATLLVDYQKNSRSER